MRINKMITEEKKFSQPIFQEMHGGQCGEFPC